MNQYQIPQFIDRESRIIGNLTVRQFAILILIGLGVGVMYAMIPNTTIFLFLSSIFVSIGLSLAFISFNGRPLYSTILPMVGFFIAPQKYIWRRKKIRNGKIKYITKKPILDLDMAKAEKFAELLDKKQA